MAATDGSGFAGQSGRGRRECSCGHVQRVSCVTTGSLIASEWKNPGLVARVRGKRFAPGLFWWTGAGCSTGHRRFKEDLSSGVRDSD